MTDISKASPEIAMRDPLRIRVPLWFWLVCVSVGPRKLADKIDSRLHRHSWDDDYATWHGINYEAAHYAVRTIIEARWGKTAAQMRQEAPQ